MKSTFWNRSIAKYSAVIFTVTYCLVICASLAVTGRLMNDENMYLSAAVLLDEFKLYQDFAFFQTPYIAYLYNLILKVSSEYPLLSLRITNTLISLLCFIVALRLFYFISGNLWVALSCLLLLINNEIFRSSMQYARNYELALLFVLLSYYLVGYANSRKSNKSYYFLSGFCSGCAIGTKLIYAPFFAAVLLWPLVEQGSWRVSIKPVQYISAGFVVALLPMLIIFIEAGYDIAYFNNVGYHQLNMMWRMATGFSDRIYFTGKLSYSGSVLTFSTNLYLLLLSIWAGILLLFFYFKKQLSVEAVRWYKWVVFSIISIILSMITFMLPSPIWSYYFQLFFLSLLLFICAVFFRLAEKQKIYLLAGLVLCLVMMFKANWQENFTRVSSLVCFNQWTPVAFHQSAQTLKQIIPAQYANMPIATLNSAIAIEVGLPIYTELATGPFAYRVASQLHQIQLHENHITSPKQIGLLLQERPPAAIVTGLEPELENEIIQYAIDNKYEDYLEPINGIHIFVRPVDF